jgi:hypothetical protein
MLNERNDPCLICQEAIDNTERCVGCEGYNHFQLEDYLWGIICSEKKEEEEVGV